MKTETQPAVPAPAWRLRRVFAGLFSAAAVFGAAAGLGGGLLGGLGGGLGGSLWSGLGNMFNPVTPAQADIKVEAPWHPIAGAYRTMLFRLNLKPVDWAGAEAAYTKPVPGTGHVAPPSEFLHRIDTLSGTKHLKHITEALTARDRGRAFAAATTATAAAIAHHLTAAETLLATPAAAQREVREAESIFRAFADVLRQTDPDGFRDVGLAWLDLTTATGSSGVAGKGVQAADVAKFKRARAVVTAYLSDNYRIGPGLVNGPLQPVPAHVAKSGKKIAIAPWLPPGADLNDQVPLPRLVLNFEERGIDEKDLFLVAFGDMLFDSPEIFGETAKTVGLACSTCHNRSDINNRFFIPGLGHQPGAIDVDGEFFNSRFNDRRNDPIDIPSLRGLRFTGPYGRDGRIASLRDFTRNVIVNEFAGAEPTPLMLDALVAYMLEFDFLPNRHLKTGGVLADTAPEAAKRGEVLFKKPLAGFDGKSCASCHVPSAHFRDGLAHDIGSGSNATEYARDGALETPTLLSSAFTAPYMHDGSLPTYGAVVDWFDRTFSLGLSADEQDDLVAYLEVIGGGEDPYEDFDDKNTPFRLAFGELSTFLSTLNTLIPARDARHAQLLLDTVAADLAADAAGMSNRGALRLVEGLVSRLDGIRTAISAGEWNKAERLWDAYKATEAEHEQMMF